MRQGRADARFIAGTFPPGRKPLPASRSTPSGTDLPTTGHRHRPQANTRRSGIIPWQRHHSRAIKSFSKTPDRKFAASLRRLRARISSVAPQQCRRVEMAMSPANAREAETAAKASRCGKHDACASRASSRPEPVRRRALPAGTGFATSNRHVVNARRHNPFRELKSFSNPDRNPTTVTKRERHVFAAIAECVAPWLRRAESRQPTPLRCVAGAAIAACRRPSAYDDVRCRGGRAMFLRPRYARLRAMNTRNEIDSYRVRQDDPNPAEGGRAYSHAG